MIAKEKYKEIVKQNCGAVAENIEQLEVEETWQNFKEILRSAARVACGTSRLNKTQKTDRVVE